MNETNKGFMKHNGGLNLKKINKTTYIFKIIVKKIHLNSSKTVHGGFIASIADSGMGTVAHKSANKRRCVTISLNIKYTSFGLLKETLIGKIKIIKKTNNLIFVNCEILNNKKNLIAFISGVWKII